MVIEDSDGGWGADVAGTTDGASEVVGGAEDVASAMGTVKGTAWAGGMIFVGISVCCACGGCSSCGGSGGAGISGALLEVQYRSLNDSICWEWIALGKCSGAQAEAQKDSPNALISDKATWEKVMEWHMLSRASSYEPSIQSGEERS